MLRKFICLSAGLAVCGVAGTAQAGPKVLQKATLKAQLDPISLAPIYADGTVGEWRDYVSVDDGPCYGSGFDSFESVRADSNDPCFFGKGWPVDGSGGGGFDPFCDIASTFDPCVGATYRWFFGATYVQGGRRASGVSATNNAGGPDNVCRVQVAWYNALNPGQTDPNGNTVGNTVVVMSTYDGQFDQFCGTAEPNFLSGVILNFGPLNAGGYYFTDADIGGSGIFLDLPSGDHGNEITFYYDPDLTQPAFNNQVMLWAPKDAADQGVPSAIVYDDDDGDHVFDPFIECFDYTFGLCPDPLGNDANFYTEGEAPCQTFGSGPLIGGEPATFDISSADNPGASFGIIYFLDQATGEAFRDCMNAAPTNGLNEVLACFGGNPTSFLVCQGALDGSGNGGCTVPVPRQASGLTVTFVSIVQTADGFCAESITETIL